MTLVRCTISPHNLPGVSVIWWLILLVVLVVALPVGVGAGVAPTPTVNGIEGTDYVNMADVFRHLGLRFKVSKDGASTRSRDTALAGGKDADLDARSAIAARSRADVFLSIHFDANPTGTLRGSEIFSLAPAGQWASDDWNSRTTPRLRGTAPGNFDAPFPGNRQDPWNTVLAHNLFHHLPGMLHTHDLGERIAHWRVLTALNCPGVLVEPAYLSNDAEASRAASPEFRQHVAEVLAAGLRDYAQEIGRLNAK